MSCHLSYYLSSQLSLSGVLILCIASRIPVVPNELYPLSTVVDCVVQSFVFVLVNSSCVISCCMGPILNKYLRLSYELLEPALGARSANPSINEYLRGIALCHLLSMYHTICLKKNANLEFVSRITRRIFNFRGHLNTL